MNELLYKTKQWMSKYQISTQKKFGQNFIIDESVLDRMIFISEITEDTSVIEIGPGIGTLTEEILPHCKSMLIYEVDTSLKELLEERLSPYKEKYTILFQDILKSNIQEDIHTYLHDSKRIILISNLPYYITTPIMSKLLTEAPEIEQYTIMIQKEVGERFVGTPNTKDYNALSLFIQYKTEAKKSFNISKSCYLPAPNVDSCVVLLKSHHIYDTACKNEAFFYDFIYQCFSQRRKTLYNNLGNWNGFTKEEILQGIKEIHKEPNVRAEACSITDFIALSNYLCSIKGI